MMETRLDEIADGIYRISTFIPEVAPPAGFTFNQFLIAASPASRRPRRRFARWPISSHVHWP